MASGLTPEAAAPRFALGAVPGSTMDAGPAAERGRPPGASELFAPGDGDDRNREHWNAARETMSAAEVRALQFSKLARQLAYLAEGSELYRRKFHAAGFEPRDLRSLEDLAQLPFTVKAELRAGQEEHPPFGLQQTAPIERIVRVTATSGTTGKPVYQAHTRNDVARRNESVARGMWSAGMRPGDRVLNAFSLSMFNAGVPFCTAIEHLGAVDIPIGVERRAEGVLKIARDMRATVFVGTPSFATLLAERAQEVLGIEARDLGVRIILGGGEPGFSIPSYRAHTEDVWGTPHVYDWASTSDAHPNVFVDCRERNGKHYLTQDLVLVELIDPATGASRDIVDGAEGEYVVTHLDREASALVRYRTGDILRIDTKPCPCGRTGFRMHIAGRSDDMLIVRGVNVFPAAIVSVIGDFMPRVSGKAQIVLPEPGPRAEPPVCVRVEHGEGVTIDEAERAAIERRIKADLSITVRLDMVPFGSLERSATKTGLIIIERNA